MALLGAATAAKGIGALGGAIIGGIGNIVGGLFGNRSRKRESARQRKWSEDMWNRQNAYNTPAMQMKRLREAGLNPALMYGQGTTGNAEKALPYQQAQLESPGANFAQSVASGAQASLVNSQKNLLDKQALLASAGAEKAGAEATYTTDMLKYDIANKIANTDAQSVQASILGMQLEGMTKNKAQYINGLVAEWRQKQDIATAQKIDAELKKSGFHDKYMPTIVGGMLGFDLTNMDKVLVREIKLGPIKIDAGVTTRQAISILSTAYLSGKLTLEAIRAFKPF